MRLLGGYSDCVAVLSHFSPCTMGNAALGEPCRKLATIQHNKLGPPTPFTGLPLGRNRLLEQACSHACQAFRKVSSMLQRFGPVPHGGPRHVGMRMARRLVLSPHRRGHCHAACMTGHLLSSSLHARRGKQGAAAPVRTTPVTARAPSSAHSCCSLWAHGEVTQPQPLPAEHGLPSASSGCAQSAPHERTRA